jgi:hypothetical protein
MNTEMEIFKKIYLNPGIHIRALSREMKIGIPSVKYALGKLEKNRLLESRMEGRNMKFFINYRNRLAIPYLYAVEYDRLMALPKNVQQVISHFMDFFLGGNAEIPIITIIFGSYAAGNYNEESDLDVLVVFNDGDAKRVENIAKIVSSSHSIDMQPVYMNYEDMHRNFNNDFMENVRKNKIIISGLEWWIRLERKSGWNEIL